MDIRHTPKCQINTHYKPIKFPFVPVRQFASRLLSDTLARKGKVLRIRQDGGEESRLLRPIEACSDSRKKPDPLGDRYITQSSRNLCSNNLAGHSSLLAYKKIGWTRARGWEGNLSFIPGWRARVILTKWVHLSEAITPGKKTRRVATWTKEKSQLNNRIIHSVMGFPDRVPHEQSMV